MRGYEKHETTVPKTADTSPDPLELMRELAALTDPVPLPDIFPSTLAVRRSRVVEAPGEVPVTAMSVAEIPMADEIEVKN